MIAGFNGNGGGGGFPDGAEYGVDDGGGGGGGGGGGNGISVGVSMPMPSSFKPLFANRLEETAMQSIVAALLTPPGGVTYTVFPVSLAYTYMCDEVRFICCFACLRHVHCLPGAFSVHFRPYSCVTIVGFICCSACYFAHKLIHTRSHNTRARA
jgi:hypothetical protein